MPTDWDAIDRAIDTATKNTDDKLAGKVSSLTRLTDEEIKKLFPTPADVQKLSDLMKIVQASTARTKRINALVKNIENLGGTVLTLLERFV